jgi:hypothetical protein
LLHIAVEYYHKALIVLGQLELKIELVLSSLPKYLVVETSEHRCLQSQFCVLLYAEVMHSA